MAQTSRSRAQLSADIERWRNMPVVCVNEPDPQRAEQVMRMVVECNLRRLDGECEIVASASESAAVTPYPPNTSQDIK